jgi:ATP phosphoribosyltransferase regulatory subunit
VLQPADTLLDLYGEEHPRADFHTTQDPLRSEQMLRAGLSRTVPIVQQHMAFGANLPATPMGKVFRKQIRRKSATNSQVGFGVLTAKNVAAADAEVFATFAGDIGRRARDDGRHRHLRAAVIGLKQPIVARLS